MKRALFLLLMILFLSFFANANGKWIKKQNFPGTARTDCTGFSISGKGYIGNGNDGTLKKDWYCYDPATNSWTRIADFSAGVRCESAAFVIAGKAYVGVGNDGTAKADLYEYDPITNVWTKKGNFPGVGRRGAISFAIGNKGYIGLGGWDGNAVTTYLDFYEYNPATDTWSQKANFPGAGRAWPVSFSIDNKGYVGGGLSNYTRLGDFWEYDPSGNTWTQKANWGGGVANSGVGFCIAGKGYMGTGFNGAGNTKIFYEYDPVTNKWVKINDYGGTAIRSAVAFVIGGNAYVGTGYTFSGEYYEFVPNKKPTDIILTKNSIDENLPSYTIIDTFKTIDPDTMDVSFTYSFVTGPGSTDNSKFYISNGVLKSNQIFNYELKRSYSIRVVTNDGADTFQKQFTIFVNNLLEFPPTDISLTDSTIEENKTLYTIIGKFVTTDADSGDMFTYSLFAGIGSDHNNKFLISGEDLTNAEVFDFETDSMYSIRVRSTDLKGWYTEKQFHIHIKNMNEYPTDISLTDSAIDENKPVNTVIGKFITTGDDKGESFTYKLVAGVGSDHNDKFAISAENLKSNKVFDFETDSIYNIRVRSTDLKGLFVEKALKIFINDISGIGIYSKQSAGSISVYPNPVTNVINIVSAGNYGKSIFELRDLAGKRVFYEERVIGAGNFITQIKTNDIKSGVYILSIRSEKTFNTFRIVVN